MPFPADMLKRALESNRFDELQDTIHETVDDLFDKYGNY